MTEILRVIQHKKAVLFDLDGTLVDSVSLWTEADERLAVELAGAAPSREELRAFREEALRRFRNEPDPYLRYCGLLKERYGTDLSPGQVQTRRAAIAHAMLEHMDYRPGAAEFLRTLKVHGYTLALTTTGRRSSLEIYRTKNAFFAEKGPIDEVFDRVYTCEDVRCIKPDPEIYLRAVGDLGLATEECIVFEDSLSGVLAAKGAGLETVVVYDANSDPDRGEIERLADWTIPGYEGLAEALDRPFG